ncbi:MAG: DUF1080 domain-containing protein [Verrucomicrobiae bacterium]|nr:DUF1080 domain-containing protein [Verrucomicrobiae bacterium]
MKYAGGALLFAVVFAAVGVAMHVGLYGRPGIFVWSLQEDEAGQSAFHRTTLAVEESSAPEPAAEVVPAKGTTESDEKDKPGAGAAAASADEKAQVAKPEPKTATNEVRLFDGKTLGKWQKTPFGGEGDVFVNEDGNLEFGFGAVITGVHWGDAPPATSNYELSLEAMKLDGNDFFVALTFPVKDSHATFVVGGWGGGVVGISSVDDLNASENETMSIEGFEDDVWYKIRIKVTDDQLQAWIGDDEKVTLDLEGRKISLLPGDIELSVPIGIAAYQTRAQYRNVVWRPLSPGK